MAPPRVNPSFLSDIDGLISLKGSLREIIAAASQVGHSASLNGLAKRISDLKRLSFIDVRRALSGIWNIVDGAPGNVDEIKDRISLISSDLNRSSPPDWRRENLNEWTELAKELPEILAKVDDQHQILLAIKSHRLAYSRQFLLVGADLTTDIRPVFDENADSVIQSVVLSTLTVRFTNQIGETETLSLTLDKVDITDLSALCDRAIKKIDVVQKQLSDYKPIALPEEFGDG